MAGYLPPVVEKFLADTSEFTSAIREAADAAREFAAANAEALASVDALNAAMGDSAGAAARAAAADAAMAGAAGDAAEATFRLSAASQFQVDTSAMLAAAEMTEAAAYNVVTDAIAKQALAARLLNAEQRLATQEAEAAAGGMAALGAAAGGATPRVYGLFGVMSRLATSKIPLFGGIVPLAGWHLMLDLAVETVAVLGAATAAAVAFGAAAAPTVQDIVQHMQNLYTVTTATGQAIYPLTGGFTRVANAVKPEVYQLFGEALVILGKKTGEFMTLATGAGRVLDQLGARFTVAATQGQGLGVFLAQAVPDLAKLGDIAGNVGGVLGNVFRAMPGYASMMLSLVDAGSKVLEWFSSATEPVLKWGLAAHGALIYAGLAATAAVRLIPAALGLVSQWALAGSAALERFGARTVLARTALNGLAEGAQAAQGLPWGWIAAAAVGVGVLTYAILTARDATQRWTDSLQKMVMAAKAVNGMTAIMDAQSQVAIRLMMAQQHLAQVTADVASMQREGGRAAAWASAQIAAARVPVGDLVSAQHQLADESALYAYRVHLLTNQLHLGASAQGMLAASGVTMQQMLTKTPQMLAQIIAQVDATAKAYQAMGQTGGRLGADMAVMNFLSSDQYTAMSKLSQAWQTFTGVTSGADSAAITAAQGMRTLSQDARATGASFARVNANSLTLRSAFEQQITTLQSLVGGLDVTGASARQLGQVIATYLSPAVQAGALRVSGYRDQIYMLGRQSTYTGPDALRPLQRWIEANTVSMRHATNMASQLAGNLHSQLSAAMGSTRSAAQQLATTMRDQVVREFSAAMLSASNVSTAINALAKAVADQGAQSDATRQARLALIADFEKAGMTAKAATSLVDTLIGSVRNIQTPAQNSAEALRQLSRWIDSLRSRTIDINTVFTSTYVVGSGGNRHHRPASATGTPHAPGGWTLVGEHGPELAFLPGGTAVLSNPETRHFLNSPGAGGGQTVIHLTVPMSATLDGQRIWEDMQERSLIYGQRNTGQRAGAWSP